MSAPSSPHSRSAPAPPNSRSSPVPPISASPPSSPKSPSLSAPPYRTSFPPRPLIMSAEPLPISRSPAVCPISVSAPGPPSRVWAGASVGNQPGSRRDRSSRPMARIIATLSGVPVLVTMRNTSVPNLISAPSAVVMIASWLGLRKNAQADRSILSWVGSKSMIRSACPSTLNTKLSAPAPPASRSTPAPSSRISLPAPPDSRSSPALPLIRSSPAVPASVSARPAPITRAPLPLRSTLNQVIPGSEAELTRICKSPPLWASAMADTLPNVVPSPSATVARCSRRPPGSNSNTLIPSSAPPQAT